MDAKDETHRFGLNAFKILGVRYAVHRLGDEAAARGLVCATAGNHGRALARVARQKKVPCTVFIPAGGSPRIASMRGDGATVIEVDGSYEEAVRRAEAHGETTGAAVISDTSWEGYEEIPRWIMTGYSQMFEEANSQWDAPPHIVIIQGGVGGLVCAAANWFAWKFGAHRPFMIACEPDSAACLMSSARAGVPARADGDLSTIMACLRCAEPSPAAWPAIAFGIDAFVTVSDEQVLATVHALGSAADAQRIEAGASGACGAAALQALASAPALAELRGASAFGRSTRSFVVITEGA